MRKFVMMAMVMFGCTQVPQEGEESATLVSTPNTVCSASCSTQADCYFAGCGALSSCDTVTHKCNTVKPFVLSLDVPKPESCADKCTVQADCTGACAFCSHQWLQTGNCISGPAAQELPEELRALIIESEKWYPSTDE